MALAMVGMVVTCRKFRTYSYDIATQLRKQEGFQGDEPIGLAGGSSAGYGIGCLYAELRDGGLARHHSIWQLTR